MVLTKNTSRFVLISNTLDEKKKEEYFVRA